MIRINEHYVQLSDNSKPILIHKKVNTALLSMNMVLTNVNTLNSKDFKAGTRLYDVMLLITGSYVFKLKAKSDTYWICTLAPAICADNAQSMNAINTIAKIDVEIENLKAKKFKLKNEILSILE